MVLLEMLIFMKFYHGENFTEKVIKNLDKKIMKFIYILPCFIGVCSVRICTDLA